MIKLLILGVLAWFGYNVYKGEAEASEYKELIANAKSAPFLKSLKDIMESPYVQPEAKAYLEKIGAKGESIFRYLAHTDKRGLILKTTVIKKSGKEIKTFRFTREPWIPSKKEYSKIKGV